MVLIQTGHEWTTDELLDKINEIHVMLGNIGGRLTKIEKGATTDYKYITAEIKELK